MPRGRMRSLCGALVAATLAASTLAGATAAPAGAGVLEDRLADEITVLVNRERDLHGLPKATSDISWRPEAEAAAAENVESGCLSCHDHGVPRPAGAAEVVGWVGAGVGGTGVIVDNWMRSDTHRAILLDPDPSRVAVGVVCTEDGYEVVAWLWQVGTVHPRTYGPRATDRSQGSSCTDATSNRVPIAPARYLLTTNRTGGAATWDFSVGPVGGRALACDWDADGRDEPVVRHDQEWYLFASLSSRRPSRVIAYGAASDEPLCGDWNRDGRDSVGVRRGRQFLLRNQNSTGAAELAFTFGREADDALVGDYDRDGRDTIAVRRGTTFYVNNRLADSAPAWTLTFGQASDTPIVGDWNGDRRDTVSVRRSATFVLSDRPATGAVARSIRYGTPWDLPVVGDWDGGGGTDLGVTR